MINAITNAPAASTTGTATQTGTKAASTDPLSTESTFLTLLVAQLKNQDPQSPQDGTQFVAQLAQFSSLEQQIQIRQDLDVIKSDQASGTTSAGSTGTGSTSSS